MGADVVYFTPAPTQMFDVPDLVLLLRSGKSLPGVYLIRPDPSSKPVDHLIGAMARFGLRLERP